MTRRGCTCPTCIPVERAAAGGDNARCPNGHNTVLLAHGRDRRGMYLQARCTTPGCEAKQLVRRENLA